VIIVLVLHGTDDGWQIQKKLETKYPFLVANKDTYKLRTHKVGRKVKVKKIDKIYFHEDSVTMSDVLEYVKVLKNSPDVIAFNFDPKSAPKRKMKTHIISKVKQVKRSRI